MRVYHGALNRLITSSRSVTVGPLPARKSLLTPRSVPVRSGERTSGRIIGALPSVNAGGSENAAGLRYRLSLGLVRSRSVMLPEARKSWPGTTFGRWPAPLRLVVFGVCVTAIGKPLWTRTTADNVQPPTR